MQRVNVAIAIVVATLILLVAAPAVLAQSSPGTPSDKQIVVATLNSETITLARLNELYDGISLQVREQYEKSGGKSAFLDNYMRKRLLIQEALKQGFDKRPEVQAAMQTAAEGALFDHYVRDEIATSVVPDSMVRKYYDEHLTEFNRLEQVKARHIIITFSDNGPTAKTKEDAAAQIKKVSDALKAKLVSAPADPAARAAFLIREFDAAARTYSEDGTAKQGGDLGWFARGVMDPAFEKAAFEAKPGTLIGPFQSSFGYHLIVVDAKRPAGPAPFDEVRLQIRERLLNQHGAEVMQIVSKLSTELRAAGKVAVFPENVK